MTISNPRQSYAWTWLPGATEPVVAGRIDVEGPVHTLTYARSYRQRAEALIEIAHPSFRDSLYEYCGQQRWFQRNLYEVEIRG